MMRPHVPILALGLAILATAPIGAATIQQDFDAAQALLDAGKAAAARDAFTALLGRFAPTAKNRAITLVRARLGKALVANDEVDAAEPMLNMALPGFAGNNPQDAEERGAVLFDLGRAGELQGKLDSAASAYRAALDTQTYSLDTVSGIALRASLARTLIWSRPDEARQLLDGLLALPAERFGPSKDGRALLQTLRGRVELNAGNAAEAQRWFAQAAGTAGGAETRKVSVADIRIRGDMALAAFKLGKRDALQKFVAYSGAGSLASEGLTLAAEMPLPACAPLTGLAPDAVAVVEFAIGADGKALQSTPVYADHGSGATGSRGHDDGPEVLFVQAVRNWVWRTDNVAKLDPFWRQSVRVELRCLTSRPATDPIRESFNAAYFGWLAAAQVAPMPATPDNAAEALPIVRAELARREAAAGAQSLQLIEPLRELAFNSAAPGVDRAAALERRTALLRAAQAPADIMTYVRTSEIRFGTAAKSEEAHTRMQRDALAAILAEREAADAGETRAAMWIRLELAQVHSERKAVPAAQALLERIVAAPEGVLSAADPIRTAALLRLSNIAAARRDLDGAATALAATGLSADQCALIDVKPLPINASIGNSAFPNEAIRWNTGGFAKVGHDITPDGRPTNVRTIIAAPPFVFGPATVAAVARFRYEPIFRPGAAIGCSGNTQSVRYRVNN